MRNLRLTSAAVLALAVVIAACAPAGPAAQSPSSGQPKRGGTLILARSGEVTNLDPHKVPAFTSARVFELVYSYLMRLDENLGAVAIELTSDDLREIDTATSKIKVQGARGTGQERYV